jgi:hypothetical protein
MSAVGVLVVSKGGVKNLQPVEKPGPPEIRREDGRLFMKNASMKFVANVMASPIGNMPLEKVADDTDIQGQFDLMLDFKDFDAKDPQFRGYREMRDRGGALRFGACRGTFVGPNRNGGKSSTLGRLKCWGTRTVYRSKILIPCLPKARREERMIVDWQ